MNICFTIQDSYTMPLVVALTSLFKNNQNQSIQIFVIHDGLNDLNKTKINNIALKYKTRIEMQNQEFQSFATNNHFTSAIFFRLLMDEYLPENLDKTLYIDADVIVNGSLLDLYNMDLNQNLLAAVENPNFNRHKALGMHPDANYFNTGVMLINLEFWRNKKFGRQVIDFQ